MEAELKGLKATWRARGNKREEKVAVVDRVRPKKLWSQEENALSARERVWEPTDCEEPTLHCGNMAGMNSNDGQVCYEMKGIHENHSQRGAVL
jgi:hypothetical protein